MILSPFTMAIQFQAIYDGLRNLGAPLVLGVLPTKVDSTFTFRVWMDVEQVPGSDVLTVNAKTHAGSVKLWESRADLRWARQTISVDLSALGGKAIILEFHFDSVDEVANEGHGVFIKDLAITSDCMQRTCEITSDCVSLGYEGDCVAGLCNFESILQVKTVFGIGIFADALGVPSSIVLAPDGQRLFVSDKQRHRVAAYNRQAKLLYTFGASGTNVGQMNQPRGLVINNDQLFVADTGNHRIQVFSLSGVLMWTFGSLGTERSQFTQPKAVATSPDEELIYVADTGNHRIQVFNRYGVYRFAFGSYGKEVGQFRSPSCVAAGVNGDIYVCDTQNNRIQVFYPNGTFKSVIGAGELSQPYGLVLLPDDTLVVVSSYAHQVVWISSDNAVLSRFGVYGSKDGQFAYPLGIASYEDSLFVADANNARVVELVRGPPQILVLVLAPGPAPRLPAPAPVPVLSPVPANLSDRAPDCSFFLAFDLFVTVINMSGHPSEIARRAIPTVTLATPEPAHGRKVTVGSGSVDWPLLQDCP